VNIKKRVSFSAADSVAVAARDNEKCVDARYHAFVTRSSADGVMAIRSASHQIAVSGLRTGTGLTTNLAKIA
jgi:hypothetical protein